MEAAVGAEIAAATAEGQAGGAAAVGVGVFRVGPLDVGDARALAFGLGLHGSDAVGLHPLEAAVVLLTDLGLPVLALVVLRGELAVLGLHELELLLVDVALDGLLDLVASLGACEFRGLLELAVSLQRLGLELSSGLGQRCTGLRCRRGRPADRTPPQRAGGGDALVPAAAAPLVVAVDSPGGAPGLAV